MNTFVLMTAMPPTKGHAALIEFADLVTVYPGVTHVIVCTQPSEPFARERFEALEQFAFDGTYIRVHHYHKEISQDASKPEFWDMWKEILTQFGMTDRDQIVSSESYGQKVADLFGATFIPYDPNREIVPCKAGNIRKSTLKNFSSILPEFQPTLRRTITFFGAESVGKTTISKYVAAEENGHYIPEYARPYLEMVGPDLSPRKMLTIARGQAALQEQAMLFVDKPFIIQDTDLFSTVGYWEMYDPESMPDDLLPEARALKSDLYIILGQDNVPFKKDQLRYGGDRRETTDQYWIDLCEREGLEYRYMNYFSDLGSRQQMGCIWAIASFMDNSKPLTRYERKHNG